VRELALEAPDGERVGDQLVAPLLGHVEERGLLLRGRVRPASCWAMGAGSTWRMSLPMYCIWRRRASCLVMPRHAVMASRSDLGQVERASSPGEQDEGGAQVLHFAHLPLAPRLADKIVVFHRPKV
jgi:hypothetical protein